MHGLWPPWVPGPHALPRQEVGKRSVLGDLLCPMLPAKRDQEAVYEVTVPTVKGRCVLERGTALAYSESQGTHPAKPVRDVNFFCYLSRVKGVRIL